MSLTFYFAPQSTATITTLVHDGVAIWESAAITIYLGETFGEKAKLWPAAGPKRGEAMKWIVWTNVTLGDAVARFSRNTMNWYPDDQKNAKAGEAAKQDIAGCLRILDQALAGKQYLIGDYTLADTHLTSFCDWLRYMQTDFTPFANVNAWSDRCRARPAYQKLQPAGT